MLTIRNLNTKNIDIVTFKNLYQSNSDKQALSDRVVPSYAAAGQQIWIYS